MALAFLVGFSILIDAAIYVVGGFFLRRFNSRSAAIVLLLVAALSVIVTVANKLGENLGGGNNILLAAGFTPPSGKATVIFAHGECYLFDRFARPITPVASAAS